MTRLSFALLLVAAAGGTGFLGVAYGRLTAPAPAAQPPEVRADTLWMEQQRPQLEKPNLGQRLTTTKIRGQTTAADAPSSAGVEAVRRYCDPPPAAPLPEFAKNRGSGRPSAERDPKIDEMRISSISNSLPRPVLPDFGGRRAGPRLTLFSTLSDGRRWEWIGTPRGRVTWQSSGDTVLVRGDRLLTRVVRGAPKCGGFGLAGSAAGVVAGQSLRESAVTGLLTALGCAF